MKCQIIALKSDNAFRVTVNVLSVTCYAYISEYETNFFANGSKCASIKQSIFLTFRFA